MSEIVEIAAENQRQAMPADRQPLNETVTAKIASALLKIALVAAGVAAGGLIGLMIGLFTGLIEMQC